MPRFTIDLTQKAVDKLNAHVQRTNDANGTTLTLKDWITLHIKELAIAEDLAIASETKQRESQDALTTTIQAERDRLLQEL